MSSYLEPIIITILFLCSGIFSGSEIAFVTLSQAKVRTLVETKRRNFKYVEKLKAAPQQFMITILIGNNLVNIAASVLSTLWVTEQFGSQWLGLATGALTLLVLIFGEIIPKNYAQIHAEGFALVVAPWIYYLQKLLFPIVWMLNKFSEYAVILLAGGQTGTSAITEEELVAMISISAEYGAIEKGEKEMIHAVLELDDTRVESIMNPQMEIIGIKSDKTVDHAIELFVDSYHSRILVFGEDTHDIVGLLHIRECLKHKQRHSGDSPLKDLPLIKPVFVPKTKRINALFKELQVKRKHLAIVVDENGAVIGLVSIEDILEEVFGEIRDIYEVEEDDVTIEAIGDNNWQAGGNVSIKTLRDQLGEVLSQFKPSQTLAHALLEHIQKIPKPGDNVELEGYQFLVEKMDKNRIEMVLIQKIIPLSQPEGEQDVL